MRLLNKQTELLAAVELANTMLVSENSKLRVHFSFMPIRYRQEIESMQKTDNQYTESRGEFPRIYSLKTRTITQENSSWSKRLALMR
jgi:hypothetical protein